MSGGKVAGCVGATVTDPTHGVVLPLTPARSSYILGSIVDSFLLGLLFLPTCLSSIVAPSSLSLKSFSLTCF